MLDTTNYYLRNFFLLFAALVILLAPYIDNLSIPRIIMILLYLIIISIFITDIVVINYHLKLLHNSIIVTNNNVKKIMYSIFVILLISFIFCFFRFGVDGYVLGFIACTNVLIIINNKISLIFSRNYLVYNHHKVNFDSILNYEVNGKKIKLFLEEDEIVIDCKYLDVNEVISLLEKNNISSITD